MEQVTVDFMVQDVAKVEVVNRITGTAYWVSKENRKYCLERLENAKISLKRDGKVVRDCGTINNVNIESLEELKQTYTVYCWDSVGDSIIIRQAGRLLNFAEIRIYRRGEIMP